MIILRAAAFLFIFFFIHVAVSSADEASEENYYDGNSAGSSGYEMDYGYDEELDGREQDQAARAQAEAKKRAELEKQRRDDDFFGAQVENYDRESSADEKTAKAKSY